jgi:hypothetical protein
LYSANRPNDGYTDFSDAQLIVVRFRSQNCRKEWVFELVDGGDDGDEVSELLEVFWDLLTGVTAGALVTATKSHDNRKYGY